jgi:hypothetical protein
MKTLLLRLLAVSSLLTGIATAADTKPPTFVPASGLRLTLETGGYKFFISDPAPPATAALRSHAARLGGLLPTNEGFSAGAVLANGSRSDLTFDFNDAGAAAVKFKFSVLDANGALVWQSDTDLVSAQVVTPATLGKGERWKRMIQIPLKVGGAWLAPGVYTLEAALPATPTVMAVTIFEVAKMPEPPANDTGIVGHVLAAQATGDPIPVKANVVIHEVRLPNARYDHPEFAWAGTTDEGGNFKVVTPAGSFMVTATPYTNQLTPASANPVALPKVTVTVAVDAGKFTEVTLTIPKKSEPPTGGIHGLVLIGPISPVEHPGVPNEKPLAGAIVTVNSINPTAAATPLPSFHWEGKANGDGRFEVATPPGLYHVVARQDGPNTTVGAPGTADVTVTDGKVSEVTLHVDSGLR